MNYQEGFDGSGNATPAATSSSNGIAGNSTNYLAQIKSQTVKYGDTFNVSKYRTEYEDIVMSLDDLLNAVMLEKVLSINPANPQQGFAMLGELNNAKAGLNNVMKFIDGK